MGWDAVLDYEVSKHDQSRWGSKCVPPTTTWTGSARQEEVSSIAWSICQGTNNEMADGGKGKERKYPQQTTNAATEGSLRRKETDRRVDEAARNNTWKGDI